MVISNVVADVFDTMLSTEVESIEDRPAKKTSHGNHIVGSVSFAGAVLAT